MSWPTASARTKTWVTEILTASDLDGQFDVLHTYNNDQLNGTTGHGHTGTTNDGKQLSLTTAVTGTLPATNGGTGQSTITQGDILYGSAANVLSKLGAGTSGQVLQTQGAAANPQWANRFGPVLAVRNTGTQSIPQTTWTQRTFNTIDLDSGSYWASNSYTPLIAGWYQVIYMDSIVNPGGNSDRLAIYKNGSSYAQAESPSSGASASNTSMLSSAIIQMNGSTDVLTFFVYNSSGAGNQNALGSPYSFASIVRIY